MAKHVFRIFVSSTFNDLRAERNALQAEVFPRLRALCESDEISAHFQPIDLRCGVLPSILEASLQVAGKQAIIGTEFFSQFRAELVMGRKAIALQRINY